MNKIAKRGKSSIFILIDTNAPDFLQKKEEVKEEITKMDVFVKEIYYVDRVIEYFSNILTYLHFYEKKLEEHKGEWYNHSKEYTEVLKRWRGEYLYTSRDERKVLRLVCSELFTNGTLSRIRQYEESAKYLAS